MTVPPALVAGLVDDAAMFPPGNADAAEAVSAHRTYRQAWFADLVGPLVVSDQRLGEVSRAVGTAAAPVEVSVVNTGGAGGLLALAGRPLAGLRVVAVESALRDLDDLPGNAVRVVTAASALDADVKVFVELPYAPGWEDAVTEVEAAGHYGKIRTGGPTAAEAPSAAQLARQLAVLVEADLSFKATAGLHAGLPTGGQHGFLAVLAAVDALVDGASEAEAADLLTGTSSSTVVASVGGWDEARTLRVRRRFHSFGCCGVLDPVHDLVALGLLAAPQ